jgi:uncharacterized repeat protein (TIGR02543 family)
MSTRNQWFAHVILLVGTIPICVWFIAPGRARAQNAVLGAQPGSNAIPDARSDRTLADIGMDWFGIAETIDYERNPSIALCSTGDQYLVVYEKNGEIYGQHLVATADGTGDLVGDPFLISNGAGQSRDPDVACAVTDYLVTWAYDWAGEGLDDDIRLRLVSDIHVAGSQLRGEEIALVQEFVNENHPAIACNQGNAPVSCLVVYERDGDGGGIYGRRVAVDVTGTLESQGAAFHISTLSDDPRDPDVAYGSYDNTYLAVWTGFWPDAGGGLGGHLTEAVLIYGNEMGSSQLVEEPWRCPHTQDCFHSNPRVAYSPVDPSYLVVFEYDDSGFCGHGDQYAIYGFRYLDDGDVPTAGFRISDEALSAVAPAVAYSGGTSGTLGGRYLDQFMVTFVIEGWETEDSQDLAAVAVKGSFEDATQELYGVDDWFGSLDDYPDHSFGPLEITGSLNNGQYLTVWQWNEEPLFGFNDYDVRGAVIYPDCYTLDVQMDPACIGCRVSYEIPNCGTEYAFLTEISLYAEGADGYTFSYWSGDAAGTDNPSTLTMDDDRQVTAHFVSNEQYHLYLPAIRRLSP